MTLPLNGCNVWYLSEDTLPPSTNFTVDFVSDGQQYSSIEVASGKIWYDSTTVNQAESWVDDAYRTVIFATRPTGTLLAWLQANGTEIAYNAEAWHFNNTVDASVLRSFNVSFVSNGTNYATLETDGADAMFYNYTEIVDPMGRWTLQAYRTIILQSASAGDFLTFLTANATKIALTPATDKMYVGADDLSAKIGNKYIGVNNQARKLIKGYIGVNNLSRKIF